MNDACIIGYGVIGQAFAKVFGIKKYYDRNGSTITLEEASKCKFIFICLPTPVKEDGSYVTEDITEIIKQIYEFGRHSIYVIRSTVYPGYAEYLMDTIHTIRVISNPEFLSEATAEKDTKNPPFILLGGCIPRDLQEVKGFYEGRIKGSPVILTDNITAELTKIALNGYFATKVIYANQIYDVARKIGANYETLRGIFEKHPYGPRNHFNVWYRGKRGVHGHCLPKDTRALGYYTDAELIKKVDELNDKYKDINEDI